MASLPSDASGDEPPDDYFNEIGAPEETPAAQSSGASGGKIDLADLDTEIAEQPV